MLPFMTGAMLSSASQPYSTLGVTFDGVSDWMERASGFSATADGKSFTFSVWYRNAALGAASEKILSHTAGAPNEFFITTTPKFNVILRNGAGTTIANGLSTSALTADGNWHHLMIAADMANTTVKVYLDGAVHAMTWSTGPLNDFVDWTGTTIGCGAQPGGTSLWSGDLADFYLNTAAYLDPAAHLSKFRSAAGKPVDLGPDGSWPTGTVPTCFCGVAKGGAASDFGVNRGAGGNWTITGALSLAASNPSD